MIITIYSAFFFATTLLSLLIGYFTWERRTSKGAKELFIVLLLLGFWSFCGMMEAGATTEELKIMWSKFEYIPATTVPVIFLLFILRFSGHESVITFRKGILAFIFPLITVSLVVTNEVHNLIWTGFSDINAETNLMEYFHGTWFWTGYLGYSYLLFFMSSFLLIRFILKYKDTFRIQGWLIFFAAFAPWLASIIYISGLNPVPGLNLTPASILLSCIFLYVSLMYVRFLDLVPVARELLIEEMPDGIVVLDNFDRLQDINHAAVNILGIGHANPVGQCLYDIPVVDKELKQAVLSTFIPASEEIFSHARSRYFSVLRKAVPNQAGSRLVVMSDITQRKKAEDEAILKNEELSKLNAEKDRFFSIIAHDLKGPFAGIQGLSELLLRQIRANETDNLEEFADVLHQSTQKTMELITNLLTWSRSQTNRLEFKIEVHHLHSLVEKSTKLLSQNAKNKSVSLEVDVDDQLFVYVDKDMISTILRNLITNAIKFTMPGGSIQIGADSSNKNEIIVFVKDNGIGMSSEMVDNLFKLDKNVGRLGTNNEPSTGLGLILCKEFIDKHNGRIWVDSEEEVGTIFNFTLKRAKGDESSLIY